MTDNDDLVSQLRRLVDDQSDGDAVVLVQRQLFNRVVGRLAAVPELLAALEYCLSEGVFRNPKVERIALAAIDKARPRVPGPPDGPRIPPRPVA